MKSLPTWSERLLRAICPEELYEQIEGDLMELYNHDVKTVGKRRAKLRFTVACFRFFRPGILSRHNFSMKLNRWDVLMLNWKFSVRALLKDKFFSALNVLGLALGISVSIILLLTLQNDLTYDQHYANHERIYRFGAQYQTPEGEEFIGVTARELTPILKETYPEIEAIVRIKTLDHLLVKREVNGLEKTFYEENVVQTDSIYFKIFNHSFIAGDAATCLNDPNNVIITVSIAEKYFAGEDPLDKTLIINNESRKVTAVIHDFPENTHLKFDFLLSGLSEGRADWDFTIKDGKPISLVFWNPDVYTYLLLPDHYNPNRFYSRFRPIYDQYFKEIGDQSKANCRPILQPLTEIHFSNFDDDEPNGNVASLYAFSGIGVMIILLACINYMNLSTAKAVNRANEVAIKKIMGSRRRLLVLSFFAESILLSLFSLLVAVSLVALALNITSLNQLLGKNLTFDLIQNPLLLAGSIGIALTIGLLSGLYPAFYLPAIPAMAALKGKFRHSISSQLFRRSLITTQFVISIFVVICTLFMRNQILYVQNKDLGFNKENVLVVPIHDKLRKNLQSLKNELLRNPRIISVTSSGSVMGMGIGGNVMFGESETGMRQHGGILGHFVGDDYLTTMGISIISGRDFRPGDGVDEDGMYIANEAVVKLMGWGDNALGKKVTFWGGANPGVVIGVVKDFNSSSLHRPADPMFIVKGHWDTGFLQIRLTGEDLQSSIAYVKEKWSGCDVDHPFEYFFLDQRFNEQYKEDITQNKLLSLLSFICLFISLLGLVGLSAFTTAQRTKEIGIRKILGATIPEVILLLSKDSLLLVALSSLFAVPFSWWVVTKWLANFAYQAELNYLLYVIVTLAALVLVFLVVLFQSIRTANSKAVDSLKYE